MRKVTIIGFAFAAIAGSISLSAFATPDPQEETTVEAVVASEGDSSVTAIAVEEVVTEQAGNAGSEEAISEMNRKAKQAEKARNAAENDSWGGAITLIAMGIVVSALVILSLLFYCFGKVSTYLQRSRKRKAHGVTEEDAEEHHDELDSGEAIAAIAMALAEHMGQGHDIEDTILTIRRMRKAYSPWNSKIYNLRVVPEHREARLPRK